MEGGAVPLPSYLSQPALDIRPAQLPVIRLGAEGPSAAVQPPLSTVSFSLSSTSATAVSFSSALEKNSASTLPFITPSVAGPSSAPGVPSSSPASSPVSGDPAGKFVQVCYRNFFFKYLIRWYLFSALRSRNYLISALSRLFLSSTIAPAPFQPYIATLKCSLKVLTKEICLNGVRNEVLFILAVSNLTSVW